MSEYLHIFLESRTETCGAACIATYRAYLADYERFLTTHPSAEPFAPETIRTYLLSLRARGLSDATLDNRYRTLKTCCRWLVEYDYLDRDPFSGRGRVKPLPRKRRYRRVYTEEHVIALLSSTATPRWKRHRKTIRLQWQTDGPLAREALQGRALVALLVDSALRAGEVCELSCGQVRQPMLIIRSKGDHWDVAFVSDATRHILRELAGDRPDDAPLFRDWNGQRCTTRALRGILRRLAARASVDVPPRPLHAFRHYAARQWLKAGLEDLTIRQLMRHEQLSTTQIYTTLSPEELAVIHARVSPMTRLLEEAGVA